MSKVASRPTSYLDRKDGRWLVSLPVPTPLRPVLGKRLKRSLSTESLTEANKRKPAVLRELRAIIEQARRQGSGPSSLHADAARFASRLAAASSPIEREQLEAELAAVAEALNPQTGWFDEGAGIAAYSSEGEAAAEHLFSVALNRSIAIDQHHATFIEQTQNKARTRSDDARAVRYLIAWCERTHVRATLQSISRRQAVAFMDGMSVVTGPLDPATCNKYLMRLSAYWKWLALREHVEANVWAGLTLKAPRVRHDERERPFTDEEMVALMSGPATPAMDALMRIAALTGARLDAIVDLRVRDCAGGMFTFKPQKSEPEPRAVPIHSALAGIVERLKLGKAPRDDLFPEYPPPKRAGSLRERSFQASKDFMFYRRKVGVDERVEGKRRALTNFHSFRRWFITQAERADQPESLIAAVVGHKRNGMTLGVYSAGPLIEQARRCVEAVRLPRPAHSDLKS